jgi:hypothetical protein
MTFFKWSQTAATNNTVDSTINWREGQAPSTVNDSARAMMAAAAKFRDDTNGSLDLAGTSTAYTVTTNQGYTSLADGRVVVAQANLSNGAAATLNVDSLGAKPILVGNGNALPAGALVQFGIYKFIYDTGPAGWIVQGYFTSPFNSSNQLLLSDGTQPLPGLAFSSDLDTGIWRVGANNIAMGVGNGAGAFALAPTSASLGGTGAFTFNLITAGNSAIEIGRTDGNSSSPLIDFHSGATATDFDARIIVTGGNGSSGNGTMAITAAGGLTIGGSSVLSTASFASQAQMEASTGTVVVAPNNIQFHPSSVKTWANIGVSGGTPFTQIVYNVSSISDTGVGIVAINMTTAFSGTWRVGATIMDTGQSTSASGILSTNIRQSNIFTTGVLLNAYGSGQTGGGSFIDPQEWHMSGLGDQ